jgi:hypothetical protein
MIGFPLYKVQNIFQAYLNDQALDSIHTIESLTVDTAQISAARRLEIYYDGYRLRLLEILENDFPKLYTLMGDEAFDILGGLYIAAYPSQHFSARYFGQHLAQFLNEEPTYAKQPYLAEMANFEWALGNTLDAENANTIALDNLKSIPPEQWGNLKVRFHPSLHACSFDWDIPQLWKAIENKESPRLPKKQKEVATWIFWREGLQSQFRSLTKPQALILKLLKTDHDFGDVCESLTAIIDSETIPTVALGFIQQCIQDGFIAELSYI